MRQLAHNIVFLYEAACWLESNFYIQPNYQNDQLFYPQYLP